MHFTLENPQIPTASSKDIMTKNFSTELQEAIAHYWDVAYKEGQENRHHDTEEHDAQKALTDLNQKIKEQIQREALNALRVSSSQIWENDEIMSLNAKLGLNMEDLQKLFSHYNKIILSKL